MTDKILNLETMPHVHEVPEGQGVAYLGEVEEAPLVILTIADPVDNKVASIALDESRLAELAQLLIEAKGNLVARRNGSKK